jgi:hypothetical protein
MTLNSVRLGKSLAALVLVGAQVTACGSSGTKKVGPEGEEAGATGTEGGAAGAAGSSPTAGSSGRTSVGGSAGVGGSGPEDAGAPGAGGVGGDEQGGAANSAGANSTAGTAGAGAGSGGTAGAGGTAGIGGALGSGGTAGGGTAGSGGTAGTCTAPSSTITTAATAVHGDTLVAASVPSQTNVTYAWSVVGGGTVNGSTNKNTFTFDVGGAGTEVVVQAVVTNTLTSCASTSVLHIPIPCQPPKLVSADGQPAVLHYVIGNVDTGRFDMTSSSNVWAAYLVSKGGAASPDGQFNHFNGTAWVRPAGSPQTVNDSAAHLLFYKVVTDSAGDAVFVWTQTVDNNNYSVMVSAYRVSDGSWSTPQQVGTVFNHQTPVDVKINRATGTALIAWAQGPFNNVIAHVRSFTVSSGALGPDLALRPSTTNTDTGDMMGVYLETNDSLTGFAAWSERDSGTNLDALYALHITNGVPDSVASTYDIKQLVVGTNNYTTDVFNQYSVHGDSEDREPRMIAVSANGNAAVVWSAFNGLSTGTNKAELYVRRYISGAWSAAELVTAQVSSISAYDWGIDNAGNVITEVWTNGTGYDFYSGVSGSPWSTAQHLTAYNGGMTRVSVDSPSGKGMLTFRDPALGARAPLRGLFYDPTTHTLSPAFTMDDPTQSGGEVAHLQVDSTGLATVLFTQIINPLPLGANSTNSSLLYSTTCK